MQLSISGPVDVVKWGYRLLYLQLFIFVMVSMFSCTPVTFAYLGAILCLFYVALIWKPRAEVVPSNEQEQPTDEHEPPR